MLLGVKIGVGKDKIKKCTFLVLTKQFKCIPRIRNQCCGWVEGERSNYVGLVRFDVNHPTRIYCVCIYVRAWSIFYIYILLTESTNLLFHFKCYYMKVTIFFYMTNVLIESLILICHTRTSLGSNWITSTSFRID